MKPAVDASKCISCGQCVAICPEVFFMGDDGISNVKYEDSEGNPIDFSLYENSIKEAIGGCPAQAIYDDEAGEAETGGGEMIAGENDMGFDGEEASE